MAEIFTFQNIVREIGNVYFIHMLKNVKNYKELLKLIMTII